MRSVTSWVKQALAAFGASVGSEAGMVHDNIGVMRQHETSTIRQRVSSTAARHPYTAIPLMIAVVTAVGFVLEGELHLANLDALYLLVVFAAALKWGRRPALFAAVTSAMVFDFCFVPPRFSFPSTDLPYLVTLVVFIVVATATSELAARARDVMRAEAARAQAEAMSQAKDALLNTVAHELRGPLTTILGWVQILRQNAGDAHRTARGLAGLERNAQLLARVVGDLLDISRIHVGKLDVHLQPLSLAPVVSRALEDATIAAAEKGILFESDVQPVGTIRGDEHRIEQVVTNLVTNAVKFTPAAGTVTVRLGEAQGSARLVVSDTGEGIPSEFLPHVFERFSQASGQSARQGLGLGLAIVKHLVDAHNGFIRVESAGRGHGTTFIVDWPLSEAASHPNSADAAARFGTADEAVLH